MIIEFNLISCTGWSQQISISHSFPRSNNLWNKNIFCSFVLIIFPPLSFFTRVRKKKRKGGIEGNRSIDRAGNSRT